MSEKDAMKNGQKTSYSEYYPQQSQQPIYNGYYAPQQQYVNTQQPQYMGAPREKKHTILIVVLCIVAAMSILVAVRCIPDIIRDEKCRCFDGTFMIDGKEYELGHLTFGELLDMGVEIDESYTVETLPPHTYDTAFVDFSPNSGNSYDIDWIDLVNESSDTISIRDATVYGFWLQSEPTTMSIVLPGGAQFGWETTDIEKTYGKPRWSEYLSGSADYSMKYGNRIKNESGDIIKQIEISFCQRRDKTVEMEYSDITYYGDEYSSLD